MWENQDGVFVASRLISWCFVMMGKLQYHTPCLKTSTLLAPRFFLRRFSSSRKYPSTPRGSWKSLYCGLLLSFRTAKPQISRVNLFSIPLVSVIGMSSIFSISMLDCGTSSVFNSYRNAYGFSSSWRGSFLRKYIGALILAASFLLELRSGISKAVERETALMSLGVLFYSSGRHSIPLWLRLNEGIRSSD